MLFTLVFDSKVVNKQVEYDRVSDIFEEARYMACRKVAISDEGVFLA